MKITIPIEQIKHICQTCSLEVKFQEQCFLCGEINWSDETLSRLDSMRKNIKIEVSTHSVTSYRLPNGIDSEGRPTFPEPEDNRTTFEVYPTTFKRM
jgi:hypothetical protein